jgi:anti-sigma B factor antagonist
MTEKAERGARNAIRLAVTGGPLAEPSLTRVLAIGASRANLSIEGVERATSIGTRLAEASFDELQPDGRLELVLLGTPGRLEVTVGMFREGGAARLLAESESESRGIAELATTVSPVHTWNGERLAIELVEAQAVTMTAEDDVQSPPVVTEQQNVSRVDEQRGIVVVAARGEIDVHTAPSLRLTARSAVLAQGTKLVLDLRDATFIDSTGIAALLGLVQLVEPDGAVAIVNVNPAIHRALAITGLTDIFRLFDTVDDAVSHLVESGSEDR